MAKIRPSLSVAEIFGPGHMLVPRPHRGYGDWLPQDPAALDALSGGAITITGDMPMVLSAGCVSPTALAVLERGGLSVPPTRIPFRAGEDLAVVAAAVDEPGGTVVLQHVYPDGAIDEQRLWIAPALLSYLNNKANLAALVEPENLPPRSVVETTELAQRLAEALPAVVKVVTDQSTGAGLGVAICRTAADIAEAEQRFAGCKQVVLEAFLEIVDNPCLNFAVMPDGAVRYLGFAEQDISPEGRHRGNWLDLDAVQPQAVVEAAMEPVRRAAARGYRGVAGVDMAITADGGIHVLDLNFRLNSSTPALLLADAVRSRWGATVLHFRKVQCEAGAQALSERLTPFVDAGAVIPVSVFDAEAAGYADKPSSALVLTVGTSREAVVATDEELAAAGL